MMISSFACLVPYEKSVFSLLLQAIINNYSFNFKDLYSELISYCFQALMAV